MTDWYCTLIALWRQISILISLWQRGWDQHLPLVLWAYQTAAQESTKCTVTGLMFGHELWTPVDLVFRPPPESEVRARPGINGIMVRQALADTGALQKWAHSLPGRGIHSGCTGMGFLS